MHSDLLESLNVGQLLVLLLASSDILFKKISIEKLGVTIVHYLIKQLINQREVLSDCSLIKLVVEVTFSNFDETMQEMGYHGCINVSFGCCDESDVVVSRVDEAYSRQLDNRCLLNHLSGDDLVTKIEDFLTAIENQHHHYKLLQPGFILSILNASK